MFISRYNHDIATEVQKLELLRTVMRVNHARSEVIPDSEEERMRSKGNVKTAARVKTFAPVVEISSDEGEDSYTPIAVPATPKRRAVRYIHAHKPISVSSSDSEEEVQETSKYTNPLSYSPEKASHAREVIDLTLDSSDDDEGEAMHELNIHIEASPSNKRLREVMAFRPTPKTRSVEGPFPPCFPQPEEPWNMSDGSILTL
ncbi:hypothetical protein BC835DRAFT_416243 [Cytidiella melzeri]|nr:hypothetical protein BC835DRAFT_416243 [Cytidiella melzeri]